MNVYVLSQMVDLGSHVRGVFLNKEEADEALMDLSKIHIAMHGKSELFIEEFLTGNLEMSIGEMKKQAQLR